MSVALLDVNVMISLLWPDHAFHGAVSRWVGLNRAFGWATCSITEARFVRISAQPRPVGQGLTPSVALDLLEQNCAAPDHHFWRLDASLTELLPEIRQRIQGHRQITDAILLDLAIRRGGKLVTLDGAIRNLLAAGSPHAGCIEVISKGKENLAL